MDFVSSEVARVKSINAWLKGRDEQAQFLEGRDRAKEPGAGLRNAPHQQPERERARSTEAMGNLRRSAERAQADRSEGQEQQAREAAVSDSSVRSSRSGQADRSRKRGG